MMAAAAAVVLGTLTRPLFAALNTDSTEFDPISSWDVGWGMLAVDSQSLHLRTKKYKKL